MLWTLFVSSIVTAVWYATWIHGIHFAEDDKDVIIGAIVTTLGVTYGLLVAWVLSAIWEKYRKIVVSVLEKDKHTFLLYRDERMPIVFHLLVAAVSIPLVGMIGMIAYKHALTGAVSVFAVSVVLTLFWRIAAELEDPTKHGWFAERIQPDWLTEDVDEYFKLGPEHWGEPTSSAKEMGVMMVLFV